MCNCAFQLQESSAMCLYHMMYIPERGAAVWKALKRYKGPGQKKICSFFQTAEWSS
ncbi:Hypothetical predicted protein [Podarcis lilfordi]|uniref:Uncharacterized protein n=1 Tax=Podarcis lilfordi TaxID=74358 RepID=A0AA35LKW3_9SAUR|nr:Hypothetical predicted protein [Podarcis lilfordi]